MPTRRARVGGVNGSDHPVVFACVVDESLRARLRQALRGHATMIWCSSFDEIRCTLKDHSWPATVVIAIEDVDAGPAARFTCEVREEIPGTAVIAWCDLTRAGGGGQLAACVESGVHDLLFKGVNDEGYAARAIILGAAMGGAADAVIRAVWPSIPEHLTRFVEVVLRRPREIRRVADAALALGVPRQALSKWCRAERYLKPEELLIWARLFLVAELLATTPRTLESIALELGYGSPQALRNRFREYIGMTATQIRGGGLDLVLESFTHRIEEVRARDPRTAESRAAVAG